jgi:hypothetical protein
MRARERDNRFRITLTFVCATFVATHAIAPSAQPQRPVGPAAGSAGVKPADNSFGAPAGPPATSTVPRDNRVGSAAPTRPPAKNDAVGRLADRNGMVSKERFVKLMADRFDAADRQRRGTIPVDDARRIVKQVSEGN